MVSRREFVKKTMLAVLGGLAVSRLTPLARAAGEAADQEAPPLPWPYVELDPEETRKLGHLGYYMFECAAGAFWAITVQLKEKIGYPWTLLPIPSREEVMRALEEGRHIPGLMQYGYGGAVGWGSLCGALNGALMAINMVLGEKAEWDRIGKLLMRYYETTPLPAEKSNEYAVKGEFYVKKLKSDKWLPQSVSGSVLCHVSVGKWCRVSGYASGSKERSERCARITGDIAARAVELLNAYKRGRLEEVAASLTLSPTTASCRVCHYKGKDYEIGQFTRGYMQCESCHTDMRPHAHTFVDIVRPGSGLAEEAGSSKGLLTAGAAAGVAIGVVAGALASSKNKEERQ
ncbi:MAG TPA: C_GCAxxG_C_C family protein [Pyrodictium sp.]|nr:C_GCAxxG_C_C family protein [Pyrodictium sp.]